MKIQYSSFKKILLTFFLLTGVLVSAGNYHIDGYVVVEDYYYAVSNEMVNIHDQNGTLIFSTITDNNGYYSGDFSADTSFVTVVVNRFCDGELTTYSKAIQLDDSVLTCSFLVCKEEPCDVYFNWAQQSASSLSIAFEALSMSEITSWIWDFGDGNFSGEENPVHEYDAEGLYIVQLFVTGPCGPRSFNDQVLVVYHGNCMAEFSYDPVASGTNYVYQFHDQSTGEITEWSWEFGGVGFSNQQNPLFDLQTPGPHFVNLQIFGNQCVDVKSKFIIVEPASTCFPHFNYNQLLGTYTLSFADLSISDSLNGWLWDFGDGYTGDQQNPSHTYDTPGIYDVSLMIDGSACLNNTFTRTVKVEAIGNCTADFSFGQPDPGLPVVEFQNLSSGESPGFLWNFGDGTFSNELSPTHTFSSSGSYEVTLYLNDINCIDSVKKQVDVTEADTCEAAFSFTQPFPQSKVITFINGSSGLNFSSSWDFGDGTTSVATSPVHEYAAAGQYEVSLAIHTEGDCYDTAWKTLEILPPFSLSGSVWAGENPLTFGDVMLYFYDEQAQTTLFDRIELTDGTFQFSDLLPGDYFLGAIPDFDFPYPVIPKYFPTYSGDRMKWAFAQVYNTGNLPGNVSVHLQSFANFFWYYDPATPMSVSFENYSYSVTPIVEYAWDFGDGTTSAEENPVHQYDDYGIYTVTLAITTESGCSSDISFDVEVFDMGMYCQALFVPEIDEENPLLVHFNDLSIGNVTGWDWDFGDGETSNEQNPDHLYTEHDVYLVTLVIQTGDTCTSAFYCEIDLVNGQVVVSPGQTTGIVDHKAETPEITLYPNLVNNVLNINTGSTSDVEVQIINLAGQVMIKTTGRTVDVSSLPKGIYFARIFASGQSVTKKFIK